MNDLINTKPCLTIDLNTLKENFLTLKGILKNKKICAVVKANAYGHGSVEVSKLFSSLGADYLAVANVNEGVALRKSNISTPILILGHTPIERVNDLVKYSLTQCVYSLKYATELSINANGKLKIHLKIDTGMGRLGLAPLTALNDIVALVKLKNLYVEGVFTHLSCADCVGLEYDNYTLMQIERFSDLIETLELYGIRFEYTHALNSAGALRYNHLPFTMVRVGISLYGISPVQKYKDNFSTAIKLTAPITQIKLVNRGLRVGYSGEKLVDDKKVAVLPLGYADGILRAYQQDLKVEINGAPYPIIGNVCMDQMMIDITGSTNIKEGDVATILGGKYNGVEKLATDIQTIPYEIFCLLGSRVKRIYIKEKAT